MGKSASGEGAGPRRCPETGLAVPECSCPLCLEAMLREHSPSLLAGPIKITRLHPRPRPDDEARPRAA